MLPNNPKCLIPAPTSIPGTELNRRRQKNDGKRNVRGIAKALLNDDYSEVYMSD